MIEKIKWSFEKLYLWGRSIIVLKSTNGVILASYPKTGSTWIRYFLFLSLCQRKSIGGNDIDVMNDNMPEFAHVSMFHSWAFEETLPLIKTHQNYRKFFSGMSVLLVVRDPRDIVVSYYHYVRGVKDIDYAGSFSEILRDKRMGIEAFFRHYNSWRENASLVVRYEDLKDAPLENFIKIVEACGMCRSKEEVKQAMEASDFSNMKKIQERSFQLRSEFKKGHEFVRSGTKAQWMDLFSEDDLAYYEELKKRYRFNLYD